MSNAILSEMKDCNTCGRHLSLSCFHKNKNCPDGHLSRCKDCRKTVDAPYIAEHQEKTRLRALAWRTNNPEAAAQKNRDWALKNPEKVRAIQAKHRRSAHGIAAAKRQVAKRDPVQRKATALKYYLGNRDLYRSMGRNRRAMVRGAQGRHTADDMLEILAEQEGRCVYCALDVGDDWHGDHIMPLALGGGNGRANMQVLCPLCNRRKGKKHPLLFVIAEALLLAGAQ